MHKESSVKNHIASAKHKKGIDRLKEKTAKEKDITKSLKLYNSVEHLRGETLLEAQQIYVSSKSDESIFTSRCAHSQTGCV